MPTKRFVWKDRDTAAQDLVRLPYHAPQFISERALDIVAALHSSAIVPDLRAITLDSEREYWERVYSLRALGTTPGDIFFPELGSVAEQDLLKRRQIISQSAVDIERANELYVPPDMMADIIVFTARHPRNKGWLFELLDRADPLTVCMLEAEQLSVAMPQEMSVSLLHRLIVLLETYPNLLNLYSVHQVYEYGKGDGKAQNYLKSHFDAILKKSVSASPGKNTRFEIPWTIPFDWPELKAALLQLRPDWEEKLRQDESRRDAERIKLAEKRQQDYSYKETAIWREIETLYERANNGDSQAYWALYHRTYDDDLSIPVRAAATHFFGRLRDYPNFTEKLALLARSRCDTWDGYYSPVRFEASQALFELATPEAWEALIAAALVSSTNMLHSFLWDWIESLTDILSGAVNAQPRIENEIENRWFKALLKESYTGSNQ
jgi:hypothetical protein